MTRTLPVSLAVASAWLVLACATAPAPRSYRLEPQVSEDAPWFAKVAEWQARAASEGPVPPAGSGDDRAVPVVGWLDLKMRDFELAEKRVVAGRIAAWAQVQARQHYVIEDDADPARDHWPTYGELLATNGDDCDGLDLIAYGLLRSFGFDSEHLFRAIIRRDRDRTHHMVTLWFESPDDPWVIDTTGAASRRVLRLSELQDWTPVHVFNEQVQYAVFERTSDR